MFKTPAEVLAYITKEDVKFLDIRFTDLPGIQQHFNIPASSVDEEFFSVGQLFDGFDKADAVHLHHEREKIAAFFASVAVIDSLLRTDAERGTALVVERAKP